MSQSIGISRRGAIFLTRIDAFLYQAHCSSLLLTLGVTDDVASRAVVKVIYVISRAVRLYAQPGRWSPRWSSKSLALMCIAYLNYPGKDTIV